MKRLVDAAEFYGIDAFLSITADNPLHSYNVGQLIIESYNKHDFDFIFTRGLPIGIAPYFLKTKALKVAIKMKSAADTEIWGPFVNRPDFFNIAYINIVDSPFAEEKRLTCDYPEDYSLFKSIVKNFPSNKEPTIFNTFDVLTENPEIWDENRSIKQLYNSSDQLTQISKNFDNQKELGREYARKNDFKLRPGLTELDINLF